MTDRPLLSRSENIGACQSWKERIVFCRICDKKLSSPVQRTGACARWNKVISTKDCNPHPGKFWPVFCRICDKILAQRVHEPREAFHESESGQAFPHPCLRGVHPWWISSSCASAVRCLLVVNSIKSACGELQRPWRRHWRLIQMNAERC